MTVSNRIRMVSGAFIVACLALLYVAYWSLPDAARTPRTILLIVAAVLPIGIPVGVTFIRRWTGAEVEARFEPALARAEAAAGSGLTGHDLLAIVQQSPLPIAIFDRDLRYLAHSDRWLSAYRLDADSLVGRHHYEVFPEIPGRWRIIHQQCLAGATKHSPGERFPRVDGRVDWIRWTVQPWHAVDGEIGGLMMLTEVITAQKEAEQALAERISALEAANGQLEAAASVAHLGHWIWYPVTGEFEASPGVRRLLGMAVDPTSVDEIQARIPLDEQALFGLRLRRAVLRAERFSHQSTVVGDDGSRRTVRLAGRVERDAAGEATRIFGVMLDATDELAPAGESAEMAADI